jgi:hypothetical protein
LTIADPLEITQDANKDNITATITPDQGVTPWKCVPLPKGHRRRIYFNVATDYPDLLVSATRRSTPISARTGLAFILAFQARSSR